MVARTEAEAVGEVGIALVGRTTPKAAERTTIVERRPVAPTGSREKDPIAVALALHFVAVNAIHRRPFPSAVVYP